MPPKKSTKQAKVEEVKMKHDCALKRGKNKCSGCDLGIVDGDTITIQALRDTVDKSCELLHGTFIAHLFHLFSNKHFLLKKHKVNSLKDCKIKFCKLKMISI